MGFFLPHLVLYAEFILNNEFIWKNELKEDIAGPCILSGCMFLQRKRDTKINANTQVDEDRSTLIAMLLWLNNKDELFTFSTGQENDLYEFGDTLFYSFHMFLYIALCFCHILSFLFFVFNKEL